MPTCKAPAARLSRVLGHHRYSPTPPEVPTGALPGSDEKMRVLIERAHSGKELWHPEDRKWADPPPPRPEKPAPAQFAVALPVDDFLDLEVAD